MLDCPASVCSCAGGIQIIVQLLLGTGLRAQGGRREKLDPGKHKSPGQWPLQELGKGGVVSFDCRWGVEAGVSYQSGAGCR